MVSKNINIILKYYSQKEKEEKVVKVAKPTVEKRPHNPNQAEQDCNFQ